MKHKKCLLFCAGIISTISSCATSSGEIQNPKDRYEEYREALPRTPFEELLKKYWSSNAVAQGMPILINDSKENVLHKNAIIFSLSFPNEMQKITFIKETIQSTNACLLVLGKSKESKTIAFNIPLHPGKQALVYQRSLHQLCGRQPINPHRTRLRP